MIRRGIYINIVLVFALLCSTAGASEKWKNVVDGMQYLKTTTLNEYDQPVSIHAIRFNPKMFKLKPLLSNVQRGSSVKEIAIKNHVPIAINGGFFDINHKSIGLIIDSGKILNPIHKTSWWSIFLMKNYEPDIVLPKTFVPEDTIDFAIQAGPRLVINKTIPKLKKNDIDSRSAIGITDDDMIVIVATNHGLTLDEMARLMMRFCKQAMALDGGNSTQLFANFNELKIDLSSIQTVANAVGIIKK